MRVCKRNGSFENVRFDKITRRLQCLCSGLADALSPIKISHKVCQSIYDGIKTSELDQLCAEVAVSLTTDHPDYAQLAARIVVSNIHKSTSPSVLHTFQKLHGFTNPNGEKVRLLSDDAWDVVKKHHKLLDEAIDYEADYNYDYFAIKTLEKLYLTRVCGKIVERPQHMLLRVAIGIWKHDIERVIETYRLLSGGWYTHATPTLFNAGMRNAQLASCYLVAMKDDSISGIFDTLSDCATISKWAGGVGLHVHNIRSRNAPIRGTNGVSSGLIPMLRVFNNVARYVNQGGKRNGSIAVYLEPSHPDVFDFLEAKKNTGDEETHARDLFYALWIPDLFMKRVEEGGKWSLFDPDKCPRLADTFGAEYEALYTEYERQGMAQREIDAQELWFAILTAQIETGTPYLLFKDACNERSNQKNLGTIKSSNLCSEIIEYSSPDETAVCNLASISLPRFVTADGTFDYDRLYEVTKVVARSLDKVIDETFYPIESARRSNIRHRPIGIGVQGLADTFIMMRLPFDSEQAAVVNRRVFETLYFAAIEASMELAKEKGPYSTFDGSPASQGLLQFDLWGQRPLFDKWDWSTLKSQVQAHGLRNSLSIALMPTASTSQILGNCECIEPYTSNIYVRKTMAGEFVVVNKHLVQDLVRAGMWNKAVKDRIIYHGGSIQEIQEIPQHIKDLYRTAYELKQKTLIDLAAQRGPFVCQSQSLNLFVGQPTFKKLSSMHFYAWKSGLKTGVYYLRTQPASKPVQVTLDPTTCLSCSS